MVAVDYTNYVWLRAIIKIDPYKCVGCDISVLCDLDIYQNSHLSQNLDACIDFGKSSTIRIYLYSYSLQMKFMTLHAVNIILYFQ